MYKVNASKTVLEFLEHRGAWCGPKASVSVLTGEDCQ